MIHRTKDGAITLSLDSWRARALEAEDERDAAIASEAAIREAYERDERVECPSCKGLGLASGSPRIILPSPCRACAGLGTVRAPLPPASEAVAALLADAAYGRECRQLPSRAHEIEEIRYLQAREAAKEKP